MKKKRARNVGDGDAGLGDVVSDAASAGVPETELSGAELSGVEFSGLDAEGRPAVLPADHAVGLGRRLGWRIARVGRFVRTYTFVFVSLVFLAVFIQAIRLVPAETLPTLILLMVLPLGAVYGVFLLGQGARPSAAQLTVVVLLSTVFGLGFVLFSRWGSGEGVSAESALLMLMVLGAAILVFGSRLLGAGAESALLKRPDVGDVFWGEIMNSDGEHDKRRPVVVTHVRGETVRVLYSTSQEKRAKHKGFVEVSQRGWKTRGEKRSFINMRDPRILNVRQLGRRIGLMHPEDRRKIGME